MGWDVNGFVFMENEPDWEAIAKVSPYDLCVRRHRVHPIWFMDERLSGVSRRSREAVPLHVEACAVIERFSEIRLLLNGKEYSWADERLEEAAQWSDSGKTCCFSFVGDDESMDFACVARKGVLERFRCDFEWCMVEYRDGKFRVVPYELPDSDGPEISEDAFQKLSTLADCEAPHSEWSYEGMDELWGNSIRLWPMERYGDVLGLAESRFLNDFEGRFSPAFNVPSQVPKEEVTIRTTGIPLWNIPDPLEVKSSVSVPSVSLSVPRRKRKSGLKGMAIIGLLLCILAGGAYAWMIFGGAKQKGSAQALSSPTPQQAFATKMKLHDDLDQKMNQIGMIKSEFVGKEYAARLEDLSGVRALGAVKFMPDGAVAWSDMTAVSKDPIVSTVHWRLDQAGISLLDGQGQTLVVVRRSSSLGNLRGRMGEDACCVLVWKGHGARK